MGITLHAIIEVATEEVRSDTGSLICRASWEELGRWEFNKDYTLMRCLDAVCEDGWPKDSDFVQYDEDAECYDDPQWCSAQKLAQLLENPAEPLEWSTRIRALSAACQELLKDYRGVRILFGRM